MNRKSVLLASSVIVIVSSVVASACSSGGDAVTVTDAGPSCGAGSTSCAGTCVALATDNANCGGCGVACANGKVCSKGACATACGGGTTACGATCNDTQVDSANCGACGNKCPAGQVCSSAKCASSCAMGQTACGSSCVNAQSDEANCGACGALCPSGAKCVAGKCALTCQQGLTLCTMSMADGGVADASTDAGDSGALAFPYCANLQSDDGNCGACGVACGPGQQCAMGTCVVTCGGGSTLCKGQDGGADYCANLQSDNLNCGTCGVSCSGNTPVCANGQCNPPLYFPSGVQTNVPIASLAGWTLCYQDTYNVGLTTNAITSKCSGGHLLLGCYPNGAQSLTVMAAGLTNDVEFATGNNNCGQNKVHTANGVEWYWDSNFSVGFAPAGDTVSLCQADTYTVTDSALRLSWHTLGQVGGYRCGATLGLNGSNGWTRVVYSAP